MLPTQNLRADVLSFFKKAVVQTMMVLMAAGPAAAAEPQDTHAGHDGPATSAAPHASHAHAHWDHVHQNEWGGLCSSGQFQSPINLVSTNLPINLPSWTADYKDADLKIHHNSHTVEVQYPAGSKVTMNGTDYELVQFHFHTPSEYVLDGERFPMEAHFVHKDKDGNLLVIGVMMKEGQENAALAKIWDKMPKEAGAPQTHADVKINAADFYPSAQGAGDVPYFQLAGSLTTPPCSQGVSWIVMQKPMSVSASQIQQFKDLFPDGNARELQTTRSARFGLGS